MNKDKLKYPSIPDILIKCLSRDFPDVLPRKEVSSYELGRLTGQQEVIDKLRSLAEGEDEKCVE